MEILSFEGGSQAPRKKKPLGLVLGVAAVAGVMALGTTLASTVTVSSGTITFGQGLVAATACDSEITITPAASFTNGTGATGTFTLGSITLSGIDDDCNLKRFVIKAYNSTSGSAALTLFTSPSSQSAISAVLDKSFSTTPYTSATSSAPSITPGISVASTYATDASQLVFTISSPSLDATTISKITVEQQNAS
jgi:hypothetical protein